MVSRFRERLTFANVTSSIALFAALSTGGAYAADKIGSKDIAKKAVKSKHIKNAQVKGKDVAADAIDSSKVGDGSLLAQDFGDGQLPQGPQGPKGDTGVMGAQGPAGATNVTVRTATIPPGMVAPVGANCQSDERAVGGGVAASDIGDFVFRSQPHPNSGTPTGWAGAIDDPAVSGDTNGGVVYAVCAAP